MDVGFLDQGDRGEYVIPYDVIDQTDPIKLKEFERVLLAEARKRDLVIVVPEQWFDRSGIWVVWYPREDGEHG